jgi:glycosyltransferase involved in cell wall biosynthesis
MRASAVTHDVGSGVLIAVDSLGRGGAEKQAILRAESFRSKEDSVTLLVRSSHESGGREVGLDIRVVRQPELKDVVDGPNKFAAFSPAELLVWRRLWDCLPGDLWQATILAAIGLKKLRPKLVLTYLDRTNVTVGLAAVLSGVASVKLSLRSVNPRNYEFYRLEWLGLYQALVHQDICALEANSFAGRDSYAKWLRINRDRIKYQANDESEWSRSSGDVRTGDVSQPAKRSFAKGFRLGWLGRFGREKDPFLWLDVFENLRRDFPQVTGVMAGTGPLESSVAEDLGQRGLVSKVKRPGLVTDSNRVLSEMDVLLMTSINEGRPNVVSEASRSNLPVVATQSGDLALMQGAYSNLRVLSLRDGERITTALERPQVAAANNR